MWSKGKFGYATLGLMAFAMMMPAMPADNETWDGLVQVESDRVQLAFLRPGADFREYTKVIIDPPVVEFHKNWVRDINRNALTLSSRLSASDVDRTRAAFKEGFEEILAAGFAKAGWEVGLADGPDVIRLTPLLINVYMTAPDKMTAGRSTTYAVQAGEATLALEIRDADTDQLLGRAVDRRRTRYYGGTLMVANSVTNRAEFERLLKGWTEILVDGLADLKDRSPLPIGTDDE